MRKPDLTASYVRERLDYNPGTGEMRWRPRSDAPAWWNTRYVGKRAGRINNCGYLTIVLDHVEHSASRLAWLYYYGEWPRNEIAHQNGCRSDIRICTLRDLPHSAVVRHPKARRETLQRGERVS